MVNGKLGYYPSNTTQPQVTGINSGYFEIMLPWVIKEGFLEEMPKLRPERMESHKTKGL